MSSETANIGLVLPELSEAFDLERHWNHNSTIIDAEIGVLKQTTAEHTQDIEGLKQTTTAQGQLIAGKQDQLTFDSTPTSGSSNPVTSGGIHTDQQRQEAEIGAVAALGAKNMFKVTASSGVLNTATIDIADDGSIHISGQPTGNGAYVISSGINLVISDNAYILSMGAEAGDTKISLSLRRKGTTQYVDLYMAESRIIPAGTYDRAHIYLYSDTAYDTTVYPMIRRAEITDDTYVPYAPTNRELYEMILALQSGRSVQSSAASLMQAGRLDAELTDAGRIDAADLTDAQEVTDDA